MAKIPIILEPGRADGKLATTGAIFDENKNKFQNKINKEVEERLNDVKDTLNSDSTTAPLSAKQGKILKELLDRGIIEKEGLVFDTEPTPGSINPVTSDGINNKIKPFEKAFPSTIGDFLVITDKNGNYVAKISDIGLSVTALQVLNKEGILEDIISLISNDISDVTTIIENTKTELLKTISSKQDKEEGKGLSTKDYTNEDFNFIDNLKQALNLKNLKNSLYVTDIKGNVIFKIDNNGIETVSLKIKNTSINETSATDKEISIIDKLNNIIAKIDNNGISSIGFNLKHSKVKEDIEDKDVFYITDANRNIVAKISNEGLETIKVKANEYLDKNNKTISFINDIYDYIYKDMLYISDKQGNIICNISKEGIRFTNIITNDIKTNNITISGDKNYSEYELFTIGDSFSAGNYWNKRCAEILGCKFDPNKNLKPGMNISTGGTATYGGGFDSAFFRVKNLYDQHVIEDDGEKAIILIENVNDINTGADKGSIEDVPLIPKTPIITDCLIGDFSIETLNSISEEKRELNACLALKQKAWGKRLTITSLPTKEGDVTIGTGWAGPGWQYYSIHVVPQTTEEETMSFILNKILEYNYTGVTDIDGGDGKSVIFSAGVYNPNNPGQYATRLSFTDTTNTGMRCTISGTKDVDDVETVTEVPKFFIGESLSDWTNMTNWVNGSYLKLYRAWRSCIEYLIWRFPKAHIMITAFPSLKCNHDDYIRPNGMRDQNAFNKTTLAQRNNNFYLFLKELATFYNIPYIPVGEDCGINIINIDNYYPNNDIHPNKKGFDRMAECVAKHIKTYL